jgi:hypothetical protein
MQVSKLRLSRFRRHGFVVLVTVSSSGQVEAAIVVVEEGFLAVVRPLRNVVRCADRNHASMAWHGGQVRTAAAAMSKLRL